MFYSEKIYNYDRDYTVINVPIDMIRPNPYQPRKTFSKIPLDELCESIKTYGLLQPITVRRLKGPFFELVAGERRLRAVRSLGFLDIPAIVIDISDNDSAMLALIENSQREQLHFLEEAEAMNSLITEHNFTQEEVAQKIGKSQSTISNKIKLLRLSPIVRKTIIENNLSEGHARAILKLHDEQLQLKTLAYICNHGLNVAKTEELINRTIDRISFINRDKKKIILGAYRDLRIFINTIKQAVDMMRKSGVNAHTVQEDKGDHYEFIIKVPKS